MIKELSTLRISFMIRRVLKSSYGLAILFVASLVNCSYGDFIFISGPSSVSVNSAFSLDVYLVSSNPTLDPGSPSSPPVDPTTGMITGNFEISVSGTSSLTQITGSSAFDNVTPATMAPWVLSQFHADPATTPKGVNIGGGLFRVFLGKIQGISAALPETTTFTVVDPGSGDDLFLDDGISGLALDIAVFSNTTNPPTFDLNVTGSSAAVPEPSSLALVAIGATAAGFRYARRRYTKKTAI
jgi:hypothetical protein